MVSPNLIFWSTSRRESLEPQQKHAIGNRFLRRILCANDNFNPRYNQRMLITKRTSILDGVCFKYEQLFHPVQCTTCRKYQYSSRDKLVLPRVTRILPISE